MQNRPRDQLVRDAADIWRAGLRAVDSEKLVAEAVHLTDEALTLCGHTVPLGWLRRIVVVGTGKAGAGMAAGLESTLDEQLLGEKVTGWINVPADCVRPLQSIHLHPARPAGVNEPTAAGVEGARRILELASSLGSADVCVVLLSGGGSALLPLPVQGVSLEDKQAVTRFLMHAGASIDELNCVRKQLSGIKGGGLARAASAAGLVVTLIISDVVGDPLDVIASGPTVADPSTPAEALAVLDKYAQAKIDVPSAVREHLARAAAQNAAPRDVPPHVHNHVIGNNATALDAAAERAQELGYRIHSLGSENRGEAREEGKRLADLCRSIRDTGQPLPPPACVLSGGEPVVHLVKTDLPQKGGRNQELVLAAVERLWDDGCARIAILSGGTDGEDGPTDAAGAVADAALIERARERGLQPAEFLSINNSYPFLQQTDGLLITGPTHTNVMDLRVAVVR